MNASLLQTLQSIGLSPGDLEGRVVLAADEAGLAAPAGRLLPLTGKLSVYHRGVPGDGQLHHGRGILPRG